MIILIHLFPEIIASEWINQALMTLFRIIGNTHIDDEEKIISTDIIGRLARIPKGVCEAIIASDGLEHLIALLNSSNILLPGNAAVTIDCLVRDSPEGQRRLLTQCRRQTKYLTILKKYTSGPSTLKTRIDELYSSIHHQPVYFPSIRTT
ncbi:unnamed protein product [Rotaria sp. Silwood2]|nr:unnamed protein product [Rotaria sp. Silwood2]CAF4192655.1 unnamed protein product [Rotaria sp. Silwood2]CAF4427578.1 unnamed protein product [Rotaria sp. Silwood2]